MQKGQVQVLILAGIVLLIAVASGIFYLGRVTAPKPQTQTPVITSSPQPSSIPSPTTTPDPTANWKTYTSSRCKLSVNYPPDWTVEETELVPGTDDLHINYGCITISAPDYKVFQLHGSEGFAIYISRTKPGAKFLSITINSVEDYIKSVESIVGPEGKAQNLKPQSYGEITGKYFKFGAAEYTSYFVFSKNNFIFSVHWPADYEGPYKEFVDKILSTLRFLP